MEAVQGRLSIVRVPGLQLETRQADTGTGGFQPFARQPSLLDPFRGGAPAEGRPGRHPFHSRYRACHRPGLQQPGSDRGHLDGQVHA
jgi:hypothetical protein